MTVSRPGAADRQAPLLLQSLWGFEGSLEEAIRRSRRQGYDGLELNLRHRCLRNVELPVVREALDNGERQLILELVTGGDYVPDLAWSPARHLEELEALLEQGRTLAPLKLTVITGSDSWGWPVQREFWQGALEMVERSGLPVSFETHRSRLLGNPWSIASTLEVFPSLRLTADLSHWCVVAERLMTPELEPIQAMADRVEHIHARVGWAQGPQVSHPFAPEHRQALEAHSACWTLFAQNQRQRGNGRLTFTPEFGPDGYLPTLPFTNQPVADLEAINQAMAAWVRQRLWS
jgi:hypothetical protein